MMNFKNTAILSLAGVLTFSCTQQNESAQASVPESQKTTVFPKGERITNDNFTGAAWVNMLVANDTTFNTSVGNVTFEPGVRTNWHYHPGGQILLVTSGNGRYQEEGTAVRKLQRGDVIKCAPNNRHWHGAAPDSEFSHIAIGTNTGKGAVVWLQPVTDEEYSKQ
jgi:quercetin dioxygenase-like cupin family protein